MVRVLAALAAPIVPGTTGFVELAVAQRELQTLLVEISRQAEAEADAKAAGHFQTVIGSSREPGHFIARHVLRVPAPEAS